MQELKFAAGYIRESTDDQLEFSPEAQRRKLFEYAAKNGYILDEKYIYVDEAISGRKADKRPAFQEMIATAKSKEHPFDTILVWKFSRFARNQEESIVYKSMLMRDGIDVVSITEPIMDGPFGSLIERIIEWMDEYYSIRLAEEVKKGMTEKARRGGLQNTPPFGYKVENNVLIPIPEEASLVREIFERFNNGEGLYPLARAFNERGIRTHRGNKFENRTIEYIIRNPVYIGMLRWNPTGRTRRDFDNENIITAESSHEPIVSKEVWETAQKRLDAVKLQWGYKARPTYELKDWPSGIVRCSECGATLVFSRPHYYKCNKFTRGQCPVSQHVPADALKDAIINRLREDLNSSRNLSFKITSKQQETETKDITSRISALNRKRERLREAFLNEAETLEEYKTAKAMIDAEIAKLQAKADSIKTSVTTFDTGKLLRDSISTALNTLESPTATLEEKNNAARSIIENCVYNKAMNLLSITYRISI